MKQTKIDYQPLNGFFDLRNVGFKNGVKDLMKNVEIVMKYYGEE